MVKGRLTKVLARADTGNYTSVCFYRYGVKNVSTFAVDAEQMAGSWCKAQPGK